MAKPPTHVDEEPNLFKNKYLYFDRNIATHYATFSKIEDLFKPSNFADFLTAIYDLKKDCDSILVFKRDGEKFTNLNQFPYFKNILTKWFTEIENFFKKQNEPITVIFSSEHKCVINRDTLRNEYGKQFWKSCHLDKDQLNDCLNVLYGNTPIFCFHKEQTDEQGTVITQSYSDYESEFLNAYSTDIAIYLIKVAIELMQTKENLLNYFKIE